jgi:DNA-binding beta-propeller fold protein YncE
MFAALNLTPAQAWIRGAAPLFAKLPAGSTGPEGLAVGPDGDVYVSTYGYSNGPGTQPAAGPGQIYVFSHSGKLVRQFGLTCDGTPSSSQLLGMGFMPGTNTLLVIDSGAAQVLSVDPVQGTCTVFLTGFSAGAILNALTFDAAGQHIYISDSFNGIICIS